MFFLKLTILIRLLFLYVYKRECTTNVRMHSLTLENTVCNNEDNQDTESSTSIMGGDTELVKQEGILESYFHLCIYLLKKYKICSTHSYRKDFNIFMNVFICAKHYIHFIIV